jgi:hypothetical protein
VRSKKSTENQLTMKKRIISSLNTLHQPAQNKNQANRRQRLYLCGVFRYATLHK